MTEVNEKYELIYDKLYSKSKYGVDQEKSKRFKAAKRIIDKHDISKTDPSLIVSCGRGALLRYMLKEGYNVHATEISDSLLMNELKDLPVEKMFISDVEKFGKETHNFVVCIDVLEHLYEIEEAEKAIQDLLYVSSKYVYISVGQAKTKKLGHSLHNIRKIGPWWNSLFAKYMNIIEGGYVNEKSRKGWWVFGEKQ